MKSSVFKKVVFIHHVPLTKHMEQVMLVNDFRGAGLEVEAWDISGISGYSGEVPDKNTSHYAKAFTSKQDLRDVLALQNEKQTMFVVYMFCGWGNLWVYHLLKKKSYYKAFIADGFLPELKSEGRMKHLFMFKIGDYATAIKMLALKVISRYFGFGSSFFDVVFSAGGVGKKCYEGKCRVIETNYFDYDDYLNIRDSSIRIVADDYIVFLDENYPYHPDIAFSGIECVNPVNYLCGMNTFFSCLEEKFGMSVVIAAHPKSNYGDDAFEGRKILRGMTNLLVKDSSLVLLHDSASVSFAVLYKKPMMFLYNNELASFGAHSNYPYIRLFHRVLGGDIYNVDSVDLETPIASPSINEARYECYKYNYLTSPDAEKYLNKHIISEYFNTDLQAVS